MLREELERKKFKSFAQNKKNLTICKSYRKTSIKSDTYDLEEFIEKGKKVISTAVVWKGARGLCSEKFLWYLKERHSK